MGPINRGGTHPEGSLWIPGEETDIRERAGSFSLEAALGVKIRWAYYELAEQPVDFYTEAFSRFPKTEDTVILDVGCSDGALTKKAAAGLGMRGRIIGLDPAPAKELVDLSNEYDNFELLVGKAEDLPLPDNSVDHVSALFSLYFTDVPKALDEIHRVLKPGGLLAVSTNSFFNKPLHRELEALAGVYVGADYAPPIAASGFYSEQAEQFLEQKFTATGDRVRQNSYIFLTRKEDKDILLGSLATGYEHLTDKDKARITPQQWRGAIKQAIREKVDSQIYDTGSKNMLDGVDAPGFATDEAHRDLFFYRKPG